MPRAHVHAHGHECLSVHVCARPCAGWIDWCVCPPARGRSASTFSIRQAGPSTPITSPLEFVPRRSAPVSLAGAPLALALALPLGFCR